MYIGEPFSWKPAAFEGSNGIMSVTTKETTAHGRVVYINEAHRYFTAEADINRYPCVGRETGSPEDVVAEVEEWAKMNPVKTRQSVFLEQYPDAIISDDELPEVAPCQLCAGLIHGESVEDCENRGLCEECRREFWMQEVE